MPKAIETYTRGPTNTRPAYVVATTRERGQVFRASVHACPDTTGRYDALHGWAARCLASRYGWDRPLIGGGFPDGSMVWVFADSEDRA